MISGDSIKKLRILRGMNQKTISAKLGISQPALSKLEKCKFINGERLSQILKILNCKKEDIEKLKQFTPPPRKSLIYILDGSFLKLKQSPVHVPAPLSFSLPNGERAAFHC